LYTIFTNIIHTYSFFGINLIINAESYNQTAKDPRVTDVKNYEHVVLKRKLQQHTDITQAALKQDTTCNMMALQWQ
jgi:hypothetical protein